MASEKIVFPFILLRFAPKVDIVNNVFEEFLEIAESLENSGIHYMLAGGVAMAFHGYPRFTRDIDLVIPKGEIEKLKELLQSHGYRQFTQPWPLGDSGLVLNRFLKPEVDEEFLLDVISTDQPEILEMITSALVAKDDNYTVRVATKEDLITLKRLRNSDQDQVDIKTLS